MCDVVQRCRFNVPIGTYTQMLTPAKILYTPLVLGIVGAGCIFTGTNPSYTLHELTHHIKVSRTKFLIVEPETEMLNRVADAADACGIPRSNILAFDVHNQKIPPGYKSWRVLLTHGEEDWVRFDDQNVSRNTTATRLFSSGTTGLPKAVDHSHYNLVAHHTMVFEHYPKPHEVSSRLDPNMLF